MTISTNFLIVGTYRTGSSALVHALNLHPYITCGLEWTQRIGPGRAIPMASRALAGDFDVLRDKHRAQVLQVFGDEKTALGFKRLFRASDKWFVSPAFGALLFDGLEAHIRWIKNRRELRIIHIVRTDELAWLRSKAYADATGHYTGAKYPDDLEIVVPVREAVRRIHAKRHIDCRLTLLASTNPFLRVEYESFAKNNYLCACEMIEFLGYDPTLVREGQFTRKTQSKPSHRIKNIVQISRAIEHIRE